MVTPQTFIIINDSYVKYVKLTYVDDVQHAFVHFLLCTDKRMLRLPTEKYRSNVEQTLYVRQLYNHTVYCKCLKGQK